MLFVTQSTRARGIVVVCQAGRVRCWRPRIGFLAHYLVDSGGLSWGRSKRLPGDGGLALVTSTTLPVSSHLNVKVGIQDLAQSCLVSRGLAIEAVSPLDGGQW